MSTSIIMPAKRGSRSEGRTGPESSVNMTLQAEGPDSTLTTFNMIAQEVEITEATSASAVSTVGDSVYMYTTGQQPLRISISGLIGYEARGTEGDSPKFREFYAQYRIGKYNKTLKLMLDNQVFHVCLVSYVRKVSSVNQDTDAFSMQLVGIPGDEYDLV